MSTETTNDIQLITATEAAALIAGGALLIDVRSEAGRASTGSVPSAVVVDKAQVAANFAPEATTKLPAITAQDQTLVVFCGSVVGSGPVVSKLADLGYTNAVHVDGGFLALREAGVETTGAINAN